MAYSVKPDPMRDNYGPRKGLEGPFNFNGRIVYYDVREGQYWDPGSDWYITEDELAVIQQTVQLAS